MLRGLDRKIINVVVGRQIINAPRKDIDGVEVFGEACLQVHSIQA
jgi:hypothetical protein